MNAERKRSLESPPLLIRTPVLWNQNLLTSCNIHYQLGLQYTNYGCGYSAAHNSRHWQKEVQELSRREEKKTTTKPREWDFSSMERGGEGEEKGSCEGRPPPPEQTVQRRAGLLVDTIPEALLQKPWLSSAWEAQMQVMWAKLGCFTRWGIFPCLIELGLVGSDLLWKLCLSVLACLRTIKCSVSSNRPHYLVIFSWPVIINKGIFSDFICKNH